jgi:hypothetical protein
MSTRDQSILDNIQTTIDAIVNMGTVEIDRVSPFDDDDIYPAVNITIANKTPAPEASGGTEEWNLEVDIDVFTDPATRDKDSTSDIKFWAAEIQKALTDTNASRTRGNFADMTTKVGEDPTPNLDKPKGKQAVKLSYQIRYEIPLGTTA